MDINFTIHVIIGHEGFYVWKQVNKSRYHMCYKMISCDNRFRFESDSFCGLNCTASCDIVFFRKYDSGIDCAAFYCNYLILPKCKYCEHHFNINHDFNVIFTSYSDK